MLTIVLNEPDTTARVRVLIVDVETGTIHEVTDPDLTLRQFVEGLPPDCRLEPCRFAQSYNLALSDHALAVLRSGVVDSMCRWRNHAGARKLLHGRKAGAKATA